MEITNVMMDPELGRSAFTAERLTYTRTASGTTSRSVTHQAIGCVHPGTPEMIQLLPEITATQDEANQYGWAGDLVFMQYVPRSGGSTSSGSSTTSTRKTQNNSSTKKNTGTKAAATVVSAATGGLVSLLSRAGITSGGGGVNVLMAR